MLVSRPIVSKSPFSRPALRKDAGDATDCWGLIRTSEKLVCSSLVREIWWKLLPLKSGSLKLNRTTTTCSLWISLKVCKTCLKAKGKLVLFCFKAARFYSENMVTSRLVLMSISVESSPTRNMLVMKFLSTISLQTVVIARRMCFKSSSLTFGPATSIRYMILSGIGYSAFSSWMCRLMQSSELSWYSMSPVTALNISITLFIYYYLPTVTK